MIVSTRPRSSAGYRSRPSTASKKPQHIDIIPGVDRPNLNSNEKFRGPHGIAQSADYGTNSEDDDREMAIGPRPPSSRPGTRACHQMSEEAGQAFQTSNKKGKAPEIPENAVTKMAFDVEKSHSEDETVQTSDKEEAEKKELIESPDKIG